MSYHRKSIRLPGYDYSQGGMYFISINTYNHCMLFMDIVGDQFVPTAYGEIALCEWMKLEKRFRFIELDTFIVMPNHVHGIIIFHEIPDGVERKNGLSERIDPPHPPHEQINSARLKRASLGSVIGAYKSTTARLINCLRHSPGDRVWQRNYYEQIIRNENHWARAREYIQNNPDNWKSEKNIK